MEELFGIIFFFEIIQKEFDKIIKQKGKIAYYIKNTISVSLSVQIVIVPIMIYYYKTISFTFLIANLLSRSFNKHNHNFRIYYYNHINTIYGNK